MSYDYINDTFGENVKTLPKYQEVENEAIRLLIGIADDNIAYDAIYDGFEAVRRKMLELDDYTIEPGYPMWLSKFLAFHFLKWRNWYILQKVYSDHPEKFDTEESQTKYREISNMGLDDSFFETCRYYLSELKHKTKKINE